MASAGTSLSFSLFAFLLRRFKILAEGGHGDHTGGENDQIEVFQGDGVAQEFIVSFDGKRACGLDFRGLGADEHDARFLGLAVEVFALSRGPHFFVDHEDVGFGILLLHLDRLLQGGEAADGGTIGEIFGGRAVPHTAGKRRFRAVWPSLGRASLPALASSSNCTLVTTFLFAP